MCSTVRTIETFVEERHVDVLTEDNDPFTHRFLVLWICGDEWSSFVLCTWSLRCYFSLLGNSQPVLNTFQMYHCLYTHVKSYATIEFGTRWSMIAQLCRAATQTHNHSKWSGSTSSVDMCRVQWQVWSCLTNIDFHPVIISPVHLRTSPMGDPGRIPEKLHTSGCLNPVIIYRGR